MLRFVKLKELRQPVQRKTYKQVHCDATELLMNLTPTEGLISGDKWSPGGISGVHPRVSYIFGHYHRHHRHAQKAWCTFTCHQLRVHS